MGPAAKKRLKEIEDAMNAAAADTRVSRGEYIEVMDAVAHLAECSAQASRDDDRRHEDVAP